MSSGTAGPKAQRRLAAIFAADVVGFSNLMGQDEEGTLARVMALRREVIEPKVKDHNGRVFKTTGDGVLVEFVSPLEAVRCAVAIQETLATQAAQESSQANLSDIIIEEDGGFGPPSTGQPHPSGARIEP